PDPNTDKNGLHVHFCHPGPAVAQTLSFSSIHSQFDAAVFKWAYPQPWVWITPFGCPVVPDVNGKKAISSRVVGAISNSSDMLSLISSKNSHPSLGWPTTNLIK